MGSMVKKRQSAGAGRMPAVRYRSPNIPLAAIRRYARQIVERFHPDQVILFGSYAYGKPTLESDVDLLVVMPHEGRGVEKAIEIRLKVRAPFPMDLLVRSPEKIRERLALGDWFIEDVLNQGEVLYENSHR